MKCAIYPYSDDLYVLLKHQENIIDDIKICVVIYPRSWEKQLFHKSDIGKVILGTDFECLTSDVECVVFADIKEREYMYSDILEKAEYSLMNGRDVIFCMNIDKKDESNLRNNYPDRNITVKYGNTEEREDTFYIHKDINCAAIGVGGLYRGLNHTVALTEITCEFIRKKIRTATIADNATLSLLGFYHFPNYIFESSMDIEQQVGMLNAFFKKIEGETKCDLMVVQFPDGMMKFIDSTMDAYGVKAFMLTRAVAFDYFVLGTLLEITNPKAYECIRSILSNRFNLSLDACVFQPVNIDRSSSDEDQRILYTRNRIEEKYDQYNRLKQIMNNTVVAYYDDQSVYEIIAEDCIQKLT